MTTTEAAHKNLVKVIEKNSSDENLLLKLLKRENDPSIIVNFRDAKGRQAIHLACKVKRADFLEILVKNGADIFS